MGEPVGRIQTPEGEQDVLGYIMLSRDEREVMVAKIGDGTYCFETKSWLLANDRKEVVHQMRFSEKTMVMLMEAMHMGAIAWGVDIAKQIKELAGSDTEMPFEYGGDISRLLDCIAEDKA